MNENERHWRSLEERDGSLVPVDLNEAIRNEFLPIEGISTSRRSFLKLTGFGIAGVALGACSRGKDIETVPYLTAPRRIVPGRAYWIATTCGGCEARCGILAKCRDGRPIKLEGNPECPVASGGMCAVGQADLLSLYDSHRLDGALEGLRTGTRKKLGLADADKALRARLEAIRGGRVRVVTRTVTSPSTRAQLSSFVEGFVDAAHVSYDTQSCSAMLDAHDAAFGVRAIPRLDFAKARLVVSIDADFLATWISPVEYARGYAAGRDPDSDHMARHIQIEARLSPTGMNADQRVRIAPWQVATIVQEIAVEVAKQTGATKPFENGARESDLGAKAAAIAKELAGHKGESLVVCGSDDVATQGLVCWINHMLGNYGTTLDLSRPSSQRRGDDTAWKALLADTEPLDLLVVHGVNPGYDFPKQFEALAKRAKLVVQVATHEDETSVHVDYVLPQAHALECWDDADPVTGVYNLTQPTVQSLRSTRTFRETLARLFGDDRSDLDLVREFWRKQVFPRSGAKSFDRFFTAALARGFVELPRTSRREPGFRGDSVRAPAAAEPPGGDGFGLVVYAKIGILDGRHAHNPWLHELPDPVSKVTWDNYACLSPVAAERLGVAEGDHVEICDPAGTVVTLPVHVQPGQHDRTVAVAKGYGRRGTDRFTNVGPSWLEARPTVEPGGVVGTSVMGLASASVSVVKVAGHTDLACTQDHHTLSVPERLAPARGKHRDQIKTASLAEWKQHPEHVFADHEGHPADIWPHDHEYTGHHWAMAIDLTACTGCSACVISCQAENNVPVVGKDEVRRHREMSWLRIDRYYSGDGDDVRVAQQPMLCQHCENAPCETVCPVLATVHSSEGLNQQVYNRCVGTRYCANNCPYKARRFNWFDYPHEDRLQNMALNPDVTIRSRGVMEKCSMCVQRIQAAKAQAKLDGREIRDGEIQLACQQSCPTQAIVFGDANDPKSRVSQVIRGQRSYTVLPELDVRPIVHYLGVVRNTSEESHG